MKSNSLVKTVFTPLDLDLAAEQEEKVRHKEQEHGHNALNPYKPPLTVASGSSAANDHLNDCQSPCYIRRGLAPQANNLQLHVDKLEVLVAPCYVAFGQQRQFCYSWSPLANVSQFCTPLLRCDSFVLVLRLSNYFNILSTSIKSVFQITSTYYQRGIKSVFKLLRHVINVASRASSKLPSTCYQRSIQSRGVFQVTSK